MTISQARLIILNTKLEGRQKAKPHLLKCRQCECGFKVGDEIVTKKSKNCTRWYHKDCAILLNIWWVGL